MSTVLVILIAFVACSTLTYCLLSLIRMWEEREPLKRVGDGWVSPCKQHTWEEIALVNKANYLELLANPEKAKELTAQFCASCGYVPSRQAVIKGRYLEELQKSVEQRRRLREEAELIERLAKEFFMKSQEEYGIQPGEEEAFKKGYEAYGKFLDLIQARYIPKN